MARNVDQDWISGREAAMRIGCTRQHVYQLGRTGRLPRREIGGTVEVPRWGYSAVAVETYSARRSEIDAARENTRRDIADIERNVEDEA
jgi:hypothetical protein